MLGWFKKKTAASEPDVPVPVPVAPPVAAADPAAALIRRWDLAIAEVHARLHAVLSEAAMASEPVIAEITTDLTPLVLPWNGIAPRVHDAREAISACWNAISDEMSACAGFTHEMMQREGNKRDLATCELELLHDRVYGGVMARAAERMRAVALASDAAAHACVHCGAALAEVRPVSASLNVECAYCKAINTVHPGSALRGFAAIGAMHLAAEVARPAYEAMKRLETRIKQVRDAKAVPLALLVELETTSRTHWKTRLEEEARHDPEQTCYLRAKLERHEKDTLQTLRRYWQWREHENRRTPSS